MNHRNRRRAVATWAVAAALLLVLGPAGIQAQGGDWEWQHPLPQGNHLHAVWGDSGSDVFAVGTGGEILHSDGATWSTMSGPGDSLAAVRGSSGSDVFAVSGDWWDGPGTILHYNGERHVVYLPLGLKNPPYPGWPP